MSTCMSDVLGLLLMAIVFAYILLAWTQLLLDMTRRPQQSGITAGRSSIDARLVLHLLSEIHREVDHPLCVAYLDIKAAFDLVDRQALWKALWSRGLPDILLNLIEVKKNIVWYRDKNSIWQEPFLLVPNNVGSSTGLQPCSCFVLCGHRLDYRSHGQQTRDVCWKLPVHWSCLFGWHGSVDSVAYCCCHLFVLFQGSRVYSRSAYLLAKNKGTECWCRHAVTCWHHRRL